jgi:outer membrane protein OmpA-like peptidoglycan-associated protein
VLRRDEFRISGFGRTLLLRVDGSRALPAASQTLLDEAAFFVRVELERGDSRGAAVALGLLSALGIVDTAPFPTSQPLSATVAEALAEAVEREIRRGRRVHVEVVPDRLVVPPVEERPPPAPPPPRRQETSDTFYEVRFVDETGQGVGPFSVEFTLGGETHDVAVSGAGIALLENVHATTATVSVVEPREVDEALDPRWQRFRPQKAPNESNTTEIVFAGQAVSGLEVKPVVPNRVVLKPPLGSILVELRDKTGKVLHVNRPFKVTGPTPFEGTTDDRGRLRQTDVLPGDYQLKLTLQFFDGDDQQTDVHESPLVVLGPDAGTPQVRMLGAVPFAIVARLHFFFNTNKSFLLPTAISGLIRLRKLYVETSPAKLLVVGHADTKGGAAFNDALSLDRAKSVIAYLKDDVGAWLANYDSGVEHDKRWGKAEDRMMLIALPDFPTKRRSERAVSWFQETRGLTVDGKAGPQTRRQLITEYMALDGVSLEEQEFEIEATAHGCGEHFPADDSGSELEAAPEPEKRDPGDRRVELFFFDSEFGIVPEPSGSNSKAGSAEYPKWRNSAVAVHDISPSAVQGPAVTFIELLDAHFRTNSAVVLPEGENPNRERHEALTSIGVFAAALRFSDERPGKKLLVAGHTDTEGSDEFNQTLSDERAQCALALLTGDRESFKAVCDARHTVADIKQILSWVSRAFEEPGFDCDPGAIDGNKATSAPPVRRFQKAYNANKGALGTAGPDLTVDGEVGPLTWGAFFDCYEHALQLELGEDADGLAKLRERAVFVDDERRALGFGEHFPIEELGVDHYESETNRRVEVLFFDEGEEPDLEQAAEDPETSEIYLPGIYERRPIPPMPTVQRPNSLDVHVRSVAGIETELRLTTDWGFEQRRTFADATPEDELFRIRFERLPNVGLFSLFQRNANRAEIPIFVQVPFEAFGPIPGPGPEPVAPRPVATETTEDESFDPLAYLEDYTVI